MPHLIEDGGKDGADAPGGQQGDLNALLHAVGGVARGGGQPCDAVGHGHADGHGGDEGDPHGGHSVARAAHDARQGLGHGHGDVAHSQNHHEAVAQIHQILGLGEQVHEVLTEEQDQES